MLRLFSLKNTQFNDEEIFARHLASVDGARREKVNALVLREGKNASLAAGVILPLALRACGYGGGFKVGYGEFGKPFLIEPRGVHFNISHSGDYTVIAVSDGGVGCDIQRVKPVDPRVAERFFTEGERRIIGCGDEIFCRIWAVKESYLKALGTGLNRQLSSFEVRLTESGAEICDPLSAEVWHVAEYGGIDGYKLAVCTRSSEKITVVEALTVV